jgi:hypothetical protein
MPAFTIPTDPSTAFGGRLEVTVASTTVFFDDIIRERMHPQHAQGLAAVKTALGVLAKTADQLSATHAQREHYREEHVRTVMDQYRGAASQLLVEPRQQLQAARAAIHAMRQEAEPDRVVARAFLEKPSQAQAALQLVAALPVSQLAYAARQAAEKRDLLQLAAIFQRATGDDMPEPITTAVTDVFTSALEPGRQALQSFVEAIDAATEIVEIYADAVAAGDDGEPELNAMRMLQRANGVTVPPALNPGDSSVLVNARALLESSNNVTTDAPSDDTDNT